MKETLSSRGKAGYWVEGTNYRRCSIILSDEIGKEGIGG